MSVFDLEAVFSLDSSQLEAGINKAMGAVQSFGNVLGGIVSGIGKVTQSFISAASSTAQYGDNIDKMSQKIGISAQAYQEWDAVMQHSGASINTMVTGMKTLSNAAQLGGEKTEAAFKAIGLSMEQVRNMSQEDLFGAVVRGLQGMEAGTQRTAVASQLLGRAATEMGALLNTSAEDTQAMIETVHQLNGVMSDEAVAASAQYQDSLQNMNTALSGFKNNLMSQFLPAISQVMDGLAQIFSGNSGQGLGMVREGIQQFAQSMQEVLPTFMELGSQIIQGLAQAISENIPTLVETASGILQSLMQGVNDNLPQLMETGASILQSLIQGISEALPQLAEYIPTILQTLTKALTDNIDTILQAVIEGAFAILDGLIEALPDMIPKLLSAIGQLAIGVFKELPRIIWGVIKGLGSSFASIGKAIWKFIFGGGEGEFDTTELEAAGQQAAGSVAKGFQTGAEQYMPEAGNASIQYLTQSAEQFSTAAEQAGAGGGQAFSQGYGRQAAEGLSQANTQVESTMSQTMSTIATTAEQAGEATGQAFGQGMQQIDSATEQTMQSVTADFTQSCEAINSAMENVDSSTLSHLNNMVSQFVNAGNSFADAMRTSGSAMVQAIDQALGQMGQEVNAQMAHTLETIRHMGGQMVDAFKNIGSQMVQGMISGIKSGESALSAAINQMTSAAVSQAKTGLDIHSPSRVFRDEVGAQISAGIAEGINDNAYAPMRSIAALNGNMVAAAGGGGDISGRLNGIYGMLEQYLPNMGGDFYLDGDRVGGRVMDKIDRMMGMKVERRRRGGN